MEKLDPSLAVSQCYNIGGPRTLVKRLICCDTKKLYSFTTQEEMKSSGGVINGR